ncbi:MAG: hypothetical protein ACP5FX_01630 [Candidatus Micrarchaeia archaeon]
MINLLTKYYVYYVKEIKKFKLRVVQKKYMPELDKKHTKTFGERIKEAFVGSSLTVIGFSAIRKSMEFSDFLREGMTNLPTQVAEAVKGSIVIVNNNPILNSSSVLNGANVVLNSVPPHIIQALLLVGGVIVMGIGFYRLANSLSD